MAANWLRTNSAWCCIASWMSRERTSFWARSNAAFTFCSAKEKPRVEVSWALVRAISAEPCSVSAVLRAAPMNESNALRACSTLFSAKSRISVGIS